MLSLPAIRDPRRSSAAARAGNADMHTITRPMAGRLNTDWFVVYVQTASEAPTVIDSESQRFLLANVEKARELGAEVVRLKGEDPAAALLDFARSHGVGHIILGRSRESRWRQALGRSVAMRIIRDAAGFDVHLVSLDGEIKP